MARFLFVVPPFAGHVNPTIPVAAELTRRGHEVAWAGLPGQLRAMLPDWGRFIPAGSEQWAGEVAGRNVLRSDLRGAAAYKFLVEEALIPMCQVMVEGVDAAVIEFEPDVLVSDQQTWAGAVVARRRGLTWATSATTSAEMVDPLAGLPKVAETFHRARIELQVAHGVPREVAEAGDLRLSEHLVLAHTSSVLVGDGLESVSGSVPVAYVGPSGLDRAEVDDFDWSLLGPELPLVLVSLGTLNAEAGARFWQVAAEAFVDQPWQGVFVAPDAMVPDPPANVVVRERVPQLAVLRRADAVVSHGGHNTVCESLSNGLPLVVAPIRDDQPVIADQVVRAGAGVRVKFARVRPEALRDAIELALHDESLRAGAQAMAADLASCGGASAAADALLRLVVRVNA
ncbi:glycosyltransferase [Nocardioides jishulii]|uniref:Glycosyltransferase family 1 protein n=1 Tax=Nocardioides jishulii TaxID=2575440 RepID=A0A4U2YVR8_9ACTN|nr:glycosyltransferase [Nocardioides jishulii]QCX28872.1 glycosyltransferase family 1 protein [Nocardioides jishulii]TKI64231.1 glycosyltransferase family 1 protein [Nocardioides jishulii]